ncbi:MAG: acyl-CoA dehydrogenase family protein [Solirubrobacteraceae bacterium]|nr:MAG: hydrolase [Solirubrobacterales bacterium]
MAVAAHSSSDVVQRARALAPQAAQLAPEGERARRLPATLVSGMADAGLFSLCVPASVGGLEASPAVLVEAVEALARGDGAPAWCVAVQATTGLMGAYLEPAAAAEVFGAAAIAGGVFAPRGKAVLGGSQLVVNGRWPFASGCQHCDWLVGGCVVEEDGAIRTLASGMPDVVLVFAPATDVTIHDTWHVSGLRATGSHDIECRDLSVPVERGASVFSSTPVESGPLYAFPLFGLLALAIAGVSLGIGRGSLDDLAQLAGAKTPTASARKLGERATVQAETARAEARLRAARALLHEVVAEAWEAAVSTGAVSVEHRTALRLAATHAAATGAEVAETAYRLGGGSAIYESSSLQRRFRDAHVATQHMLVAPATWELTGRLLLGLPTDVTQL